MNKEELLQDLKYFAFRDYPSVLLKQLNEKVEKAEKDNIDFAVYTTVYNKAKLIYDSAHYYYNFLVDTFMDVDYSLEATDGYLDYSVEELLTVLNAIKIVEK